MNEKDRDFSTLDLEAIIREFGGGTDPLLQDEKLNTTSLNELIASVSAEEEAAPGESPEAEAAPDKAAEPEQSAEPDAAPPAAAEEAPEQEPTVRLEEISNAAEKVAEEEKSRPEKAEPLCEEEDEAEEVKVWQPSQKKTPPALKPAAKAGDAPEPENEATYDDEDDDEVELPHLPPLIFKPKSRLQQLRSELVAGPEKRYYELTEMGVGKLQLAIFLCLVVIVLSGTSMVMYGAGMIAVKRLKLMIFCQILTMLLGGLLGSHQMVEGLCDILRGRFTLNTLLGVSFVACCVDGVFCLLEERIPLCAAFTLQVAMSLWATYHKRTTEMGQMDSLRKAVRLDAVVRYEEFYENKAGYLRREGHVDDFMVHYDEISGPEKLQNRFAALSLVAAIGVAVAAGLLHSLSMALQIFSATLLVAAPASIFVTLSRPAAVVERKLHSLGTVLCGWSGVLGLCGKGVIPLKDQDLFPNGTAKLNGVKFYGDRDPEETIAYAAALINANGGSLAPAFNQLLDSRGGICYGAENLQYYGNGGIGGEVCGEPVLIGTMEFLKAMGVEIPEETMVKQAVYISIDGEFSGLFAINYTRTKFSVGGISTLSNYRHVSPIVVARDFMLTAPFLKEKFGISGKRLTFPERAVQDALAARKPAEDAAALALTTQDGLAPLAYAITGARALRAASRLGMAIHIIGGALGIAIMLALAIVGAVHLVGPLHVLLYQLIWMVPGLLVTMWPHTI